MRSKNSVATSDKEFVISKSRPHSAGYFGPVNLDQLLNSFGFLRYLFIIEGTGIYKGYL